MYLPRRHYRRLLLPPGWVALGFLLLLGCQALLTHERQLRLPNVMQLTMPLLESKVTKQLEGSISEFCFCRPLTHIKVATYWQNAQIRGNDLAYPVNQAALETAVRAIQADEGHARGVRVYFRQTATYGSLVSLLDMMNRLDQHKYWLDIEHQPVTFYAINDKALKTSRSPKTTY